MDHNLATTLPRQTMVELVSQHGIDPTLLHPDTLVVGPANAYLKGLEHWGNERNLNTTHGQLATRANTWAMVRQATDQAKGGWSLFSVPVNQHGWPTAGSAFLGHRIHPSSRTPDGLRFDTRGWHLVNRGLMLPPLSLDGAVELLEHHGFQCDHETYESWQAWRFILHNPDVRVWVEESALKALAATSFGQIAVGINGINSWGQKGRPDRLHPFLKRLARNGRKVVVRFDRAESVESQSEIQARKLATRLEREGARGGGWSCWPPLPGKMTPLHSDHFNHQGA